MAWSVVRESVPAVGEEPPVLVQKPLESDTLGRGVRDALERE